MPPKEKKVSLVVKSDNLAPLKLRHRRKECLKHPSNSVTKMSGEIVENELWKMFCGTRMALS